jgi:hypothetical protein
MMGSLSAIELNKDHWAGDIRFHGGSKEVSRIDYQTDRLKMMNDSDVQWGHNATTGNASIWGTIPIVLKNGVTRYIMLSDVAAS